MKTFKTNKKYNVPFGRSIVKTEVYLKISAVEMDENGVVAKGYYYIVVDGKYYQLDNIVPSVLQWSVISHLEGGLSAFSSNSLNQAIMARVEEFTLLKLKQEDKMNYGISYSDWHCVEPHSEENYQ